jgi:hypothetical protein
MSTLLAAAQVKAPVIDYKELSPLFALAGGSVIVLMVGLFRSVVVRRVWVPVLTAVALLTAIGLTIWIWEPGGQDPIVEGALKVDALSLGVSMLYYVAGLVRPARASSTRFCSARSPAWSCSRRRTA